MNISTFQFVFSNITAAINFFLLIYCMIRVDKEGYLSIRIISMIFMLMTYAVSFCWSSVITNIFALIRDLYCVKTREKNNYIVAAIVISGALAVLLINRTCENTFTTYLPVISFVFYSTMMFRTKTAFQMKLINSIDVLLWIVYDYKNMLVFCVVQDLFIVLMTFAEQYVKLDNEDVLKE